jgi:hypothetical protein
MESLEGEVGGGDGLKITHLMNTLTQEEKLLFEQIEQERKELYTTLTKKKNVVDFDAMFETITDLYKESVHFIYELLQNADDAEATSTRISLFEDRIEFAHNGNISFSISDDENMTGHINAITALGKSQKVEDVENKIGKFGIGFKAIYKYTLCPKIYNPPYNFEIQNVIVPVYLKNDSINLRDNETTLFVLPFNNPDKSAKDIYEEVSNKLFNMSNPLLFLRRLNVIKWEVGNKKGVFSKKIQKDFSSDFHNLQVEKITLDEVLFLKISRQIVILNDNKKYHQVVSVAYSLEDKNIIKSAKIMKQYAYCFFQTKEYTGLDYLIHAPFILTPNRESIKEKSKINDQLIDELAKLSADSLDVFKGLGFLNDKLFEVLPLGEIQQQFKSIGNAVDNKLKEGVYFPVNNGQSFTSSENAYFSESQDLNKLLASDGFHALKELTDNTNAVWVLDSYSRGSSVAKNIRSIIQDSFDPDKVATRINKEFMEQMSDEWIISFYRFLRKNQSSLWQKSTNWRQKPVLRTKPIIKLENGIFISPFDVKDELQVYLPTNLDTPVPTVLSTIANDDEALLFLKELGLIEPDEGATVWHEIIPKLQRNEINNDEDLLEITKVIIRYYHNCDYDNKIKLKKQLSEIKFVRQFKKVFNLNNPSDTYILDKSLQSYFKYTKLRVNWLSPTFYKILFDTYGRIEVIHFLTEIGVNRIPKLIGSERSGRQYWASKYGYSKNYACYVTDYLIEGFDTIVDSDEFNLDISALIFSLLKIDDLWRKMSVKVETPRTTYKKGDNFHINYIKNNAWLYDKNLNLKKANEIYLEDLNDIYNLEDNARGLIERLDFKEKVYVSFNQKIRKRFPSLSEEEILQKIEELLNRTQSSPSEGISKQKKTKLEEEGEAIVKGAKDKKGHSIPKPKESDDIERDEFTPPSIDIEKELQKERDLLEDKLAQLVYKAKLQELVNTSEIYSFAWFKALLRLENQVNADDRSQKGAVRAIFRKARLDGENILVLFDTNFIPSSIEERGELSIKFNFKDGIDNINVDTVSVQKKELRIKLRDGHSLKDIDKKELSSAIVEVKNASFILDKLENAFAHLPFEDEDNLHENITADIDFVFGPPGTGKTTHIAKEILIPMMEEDNNSQILVLTPTNKAADVLCEKIIKSEEEVNSSLYLDWLTRFGITNSFIVEESEIFIQDKRISKRKAFGSSTMITTIARYPYDGFIVPNQNPEKNDGNDMDFKLKNFKWDYIVFDESSMISLASILYVIYNAKQVNPDCKFIVAGDPFQISPVIFVDKKGWKDGNIYSMTGLNKSSSFKNPETTPHNFKVANLTTQWRAIEPLGTICSELSYDGILKHNRTIADIRTIHLAELPLKPITIIYFNVNKEESLYKPRKLNGSNYHIYSALFTIEFIDYIMQNLQIEDGEPYKIGVICPYKSQQGILNKVLQTKQTGTIEVTTGTIHGFQGDECDMIINLLNPPSYISRNNNRIFLNKKNILNVSVSRGKDHLILLIPRDKTGKIQTENLHVIERIKHIIKNNPQIKSHYKEYDSHQIEEVILGEKYAIEGFSFPTAHQSINVYTEPEDIKYEVRFDENAIDVQVNQPNKKIIQ